MATGYEDKRFQTLVDENLHCVICTKVLRDPVQCRRNEHHFCRNCIIEHLKHSQNCPTCKDHLTIKTLVKPQRFLANNLSKLKISCQNSERGCPAVVELGSLNTHVASCEFNPIPCSNDQCDEIISQRDKEIHESKVCDFRRVKCDYCGETVVYKNLMLHTCPARCEIRGMKAEMINLKRQVNKLCSSQDEMLKMIQNMMSNLVRPGRNAITAQEQQTEIFIVGGNDDKSAEVLNMSTKIWRLSSEMNGYRYAASSVLYQGHVIVTGGTREQHLLLDSVEELNLAQQDKHWVKSKFKLPLKLQHHVCLVHQNRLLVIGGLSLLDVRPFHAVHDSIYEIQLTPPYTSKLLTRMPRSVVCHGAQIVNNMIYIFGGRTSQCGSNAIDNVLMFDPATHNFTELPSLPYSVSAMATVTWKDNVVVLGGIDKKADPFNTVILYNVTTGSYRMLPSMKKGRYGCRAVSIGDNIVVMGGLDDDSEYLNSVECYNFDTNTWTEFPAMIKARTFATAVVKYC